jgi:polyisoprenoid-binding protein YceI
MLNSNIKTTFAAFLCVLSLFACKNDPKTTDTANANAPKVDTIKVAPVPTTGAATYLITDGTVYWAAKKSTGSEHTGTVTIQNGSEIQVNQGQLQSGVASIDMNTIAVTDIKDSGERRELESHLKDSDFFDVAKFPKGEIKFLEVFPSNIPEFNCVITCNLTLKGKTNPVNIPVKVTVNGDELVAESPTFAINRTQWGINFHSGILGTVKDKLIEDMVRLTLKVKAKRKV